jgi:TIR domain
MGIIELIRKEDTMPTQPITDAFISSCPQDWAWVENTLLPRLHAAGLRVDFVEAKGKLDAITRGEIVRRIGQARYVVAVLSPASLMNSQAQFEREVALERNYQERIFCLLPVKIAHIDEQQIPKQLTLLATVDFTQPDRVEDAFAHLLWAWE